MFSSRALTYSTASLAANGSIARLGERWTCRICASARVLTWFTKHGTSAFPFSAYAASTTILPMGYNFSPTRATVTRIPTLPAIIAFFVASVWALIGTVTTYGRSSRSFILIFSVVDFIAWRASHSQATFQTPGRLPSLPASCSCRPSRIPPCRGTMPTARISPRQTLGASIRLSFF